MQFTEHTLDHARGIQAMQARESFDPIGRCDPRRDRIRKREPRVRNCDGTLPNSEQKAVQRRQGGNLVGPLGGVHVDKMAVRHCNLWLILKHGREPEILRSLWASVFSS